MTTRLKNQEKCDVVGEPSDPLLSLYNHLDKLPLLIVIDHSRAGNGFFKRIFDQHPEVLSIPIMSYLYSSVLLLFQDRETIPGEDAYCWALNESNAMKIAQEMTSDLQRSFIRVGNDPHYQIDRVMARDILARFLRGKSSVTRKEVVVSLHLAHACATGRSINGFRYLLLDDSTHNDRVYGDKENERFVRAIRDDYPVFRIIHLVRDPRASFSSLKHQYLNRFTMYPVVAPAYIWKIALCNCVIIWILRYTTSGAKAMADWQKELDNSSFFRVRNEDLNLNFVKTMGELTRYLGVSWYDPWSLSDYIPTSNGVPWKGISAYSGRFTGFRRGVLKNEPDDKACFPGPNREVTERWKKKLAIREVMLVESIYYKEMRELGYEFQYVFRRRDRVKALMLNIMPLRGEIPDWQWWTSGWTNWKEALKKILFVSFFPLSFIGARTIFLCMYAAGRFSLR